MKTLKEFDLTDKKVLLRCDLNVPLNADKTIADDFRIEKALDTIRYLLSSNCQVIIISHLQSPEGRDPNLSLEPVAKRLEELLGEKVTFITDCVGEEVKSKIKEGSKVVLLENLRYYKEEKANDPEFSRKLSELADFFVQDGFGVCHRAHASVVGIAKFLPSCAGLLLEREVKELSKFFEEEDQSLAAVIGGAKIKTKVALIEKFLEKADYLLLGGKIANTVLEARGVNIMSSKEAEGLTDNINVFSKNIYLPQDGMIGEDENNYEYAKLSSLNETKTIFDIGEETIEKYKEIILKAEMIIWNGPVGCFEKEQFSKGTLKIANAIAQAQGYSIVGGGETVELINKEKLTDKFNHVSTGGGAMLEFLGGKVLPGIEVLE